MKKSINEINPLFLIDGYKVDHRSQYPKNTSKIYSNFTPRKSRNNEYNEVVFYGLQYFVKEYIIDRWNKLFFNRPKSEVVNEYKRRIENYLGKDVITFDHIEKLHDLGYLPIEIKALDEGTLVPMGVPVITVVNTVDEFFWLTNYFETILSNMVWKPCTNATTAFVFRKNFEKYADITGYVKDFIKWQGHDFSFRGMSESDDAIISGSSHLLSFTGTDTVPAIDFHEIYYNADSDKELIGGSVAATEHSIMSAGGNLNEYETFKRLITEVYSKGIVSIVSDTWDFWNVITNIIPSLKNEILNRDGRTVLRPDTGNPVKIICGDPDSVVECVRKGSFECLYDIFGGSVNAKGYIELNPKIGLIYGDAINLERQLQILSILESKGFSANNLVLGIGSYSYNLNTRDTYGFAMKATYAVVDDCPRNIFKSPKTDTVGFKKSATGLLMVYEEDGKLKMKDNCSSEEEKTGLLTTVFKDGKLVKETSLQEIRNKIDNYFKK